MSETYQSIEQESDMVKEPFVSSPSYPENVSPVDALWTLIMKQSRKIRNALTEKLLSADIEAGERLLLKASIERGWQQVKEMQAPGKHHGTLQDLIKDLPNFQTS